MDKFYGLGYGPYREGQNPATGPRPNESQVLEDMKRLSGITHRVRSYSTQGGLKNLDMVTQSLKMKANIGLYINIVSDTPSNNAEISNALAMVQRNDNTLAYLKRSGRYDPNNSPSSIECFTVGNETVIHEGKWNPNASDVDVSLLVKCIRKIKEKTDIPVTTAEPWYVWKNYPQLVDEIDFITAHIYPSWDNIPIENAAGYVVEKYDEIKARFPGKDIVIGETGWATAGKTDTPSTPANTENAKRFLNDFLGNGRLAGSKYYMFQAFDESWKSESSNPDPVGPHWGLMDSRGTVKSCYKTILGPLLASSPGKFDAPWR